MLKIVLTVLVLIFVNDSLSVDMPLSEREEIHKTIAECNAESGIDIENIWSLGTGDFSVQDQKTKCFTKCYAVKQGLIDENGDPHRDVIIYYAQKFIMDKDLAAKIVDICVPKEKGDDICHLTYSVYQCAWTEYSKTIIGKNLLVLSYEPFQ